MKKLFIISLCCFCILSCEDFLTEENVSGIGYDYYETETGVEASVSASYAAFRSWAGNIDNGGYLMICGTDMWQSTNVSSSNPWNQYLSSINQTNNGNYNNVWNNFYKGIQNCNLALNRIPQLSNATEKLATDEGKKQRMGEACFLRAYYYYILINNFGRVPLLLEENTGILNEMKRASLAEIYAAIITDLRFAAEYLPATQTEYARPTQAAAQSLLAKIYLTRGSAVTEDRGQKPTDQDSAIFYAQKVIDYKGGLIPDYHDANRQDNEKNNDVLFAVQYTTEPLYNGSGNGMHRFFVIQYEVIQGMQRNLEYDVAWIRASPTDYLYDLYDPSIDSRFYKNFQTVWYCNVTNEAQLPKWTAANAPTPDKVGQPRFVLGDTAIYVSMHKDVPDAEINAKPYWWYPRNKFKPHGSRHLPQYRYHMDPYRSSVESTVGTLDFKLLWLSDTYLTIAEAYGRKGDYAKAAEYINVVRKRAAYKEGEIKPGEVITVHGGDPAQLTSSTETAMMITVEQINSPEKLRDFILDERGRELCGTFDRRFDLLRTETFYDRIKQYNPYAAPNIKEFHKWRPIPQNHIDRLQNPGPVEEEQNPGYY